MKTFNFTQDNVFCINLESSTCRKNNVTDYFDPRLRAEVKACEQFHLNE